MEIFYAKWNVSNYSDNKKIIQSLHYPKKTCSCRVTAFSQTTLIFFQEIGQVGRQHEPRYFNPTQPWTRSANS